MTSLWSTDNPEKLLKLSREIEAKGLWKGVLSPVEHCLFKAAVDAGGHTWEAFIQGRAKCEVERLQPVVNTSTSNNTGSTAARDQSVLSNANGIGRSSLSKSGDATDESQRGRDQSESPSASRTGSAAPADKVKEHLVTVSVDSMTIACRVRYLLFEKSLPVLFPDPAIGLTVDFDEALLECESDEEAQSKDPKKSNADTRDVDDDYDDDEEDGDQAVGDHSNSDPATSETQGHSHEPINIKVTVDKETDEDEDDMKLTKDIVINNYTKNYHIFEHDRENALRQRRLVESDRQVDSDIVDENTTHELTANGSKKMPSNQFGAANLSLKHLLATVEAKRDSLSLTDFELKNLISDVRKNRSKWASEDKIGQEELYEAAEKVVLELRGYTEHSTAFLNKVNKRDAPNYFNVIKHPMDLSTVMKKLKSFQYKSKKDFVSDLMLIWKNCLTYNADPKHFLRAHAIAMEKKTLTLIPLIPDITIRDRAEVEAEEKAAQEEGEEDGDQPKSRMGMGKSTAKHAAKGKKRTFQEADAADGTGAEDVSMTEASEQGHENSKPIAEAPVLANPALAAVAASFTERTGSPIPGTPRSGTPGGEYDADSSLLQTEESFSENEEHASEEHPQDLETRVWQEVFTKRRAEYCCKRGDLFKNDKMQRDAEATIRRPMAMGRFSDITSHIYKPIDESGKLKRERFFQSRGLLEALDAEKQQFIVEYEVGSGVPANPIMAYDAASIAENGEPGFGGYHAEMANINDLPPSNYVLHGGLSESYDLNLKTIQEIRKICSKIALVRQMQQQQYLHPPQPYNPEQLLDIDLDIESRLPDRDKYDGPASLQAMKRAVSKMAMHSGFEVTELMAIDTLTEIAGEYISKFGKLLMLSTESPEFSEMTSEETLTWALQEQGIESLSSLDVYIREDVQRNTTRLRDLQKSLTVFLADLLRPGIQEFSDNQFDDGSDQFFNGDFSQQIGDDFFGFRELGLDKELGALGTTVPFHLLQSRLASSNKLQLNEQVSKEFAEQVPDYLPINRQAATKQLSILQPFFLARLDLNGASTQVPKHDNANELETVLLEAERLPPKQRNTRPKLPPTGKIPGVKKKSISKCFFKPEKSANTDTTRHGDDDGALFGGDDDDDLFLDNLNDSLEDKLA